MKITATCTLNGHDLSAVPVLNPGGWFGKTWLVEIGGYYSPLFLVVEADTISDAIDELSDDSTYGHQIHVPESDESDGSDAGVEDEEPEIEEPEGDTDTENDET